MTPLFDPTAAPPLPAETRPLATDVFMTHAGDDLVVLDLRTDTYACLPSAGPRLQITAGSVRADLGLLALLAEAGLLADTIAAPPAPLPDRPVIELQLPRAPCAWASVPGLARAAWIASRLGPQPPIRSLIKALPPAGRRLPNPARVARTTAAFRRLLPWIPGQGACLYRAFVLLCMLRWAGQNATWVFGVRTWPFGAHCWLQLGSELLDDDCERVAQYAPIMAVS